MKTIAQQNQALISDALVTVGLEKADADRTAKRFLECKLEYLPRTVSYRLAQKEIIFYCPNGIVSVDIRTHELCISNETNCVMRAA